MGGKVNKGGKGEKEEENTCLDCENGQTIIPTPIEVQNLVQKNGEKNSDFTQFSNRIIVELWNVFP